MSAVKAVRVQILGIDYWLSSDRQEEHLHEVATSLDEKLREILAASNASNASKKLSELEATVLVALNLTNELLQLQEMQDKLLRDFENQLDTVLLNLKN